MPRLSANLGFLWQDRPLPDRITAAAAAGFSAVECHFPYEFEPEHIASALTQTGLRMISLNTGLGANGQEDFGVIARPDRRSEARELIDQAIDYASRIGCERVNVVPGRTHRAEGCEAEFQANLAYAASKAAPHNIGLLIEPLSAKAVPGAHCSLLKHALDTIDAVGSDNVTVMFDCFHVQTMEGNLAERLESHLDTIGHIQIASVPDRAEPDRGEIDYQWLFQHLDTIGYGGWVGAEYHPATTTDAGLGWLDAMGYRTTEHADAARNTEETT